jgi:hypothetical protein
MTCFSREGISWGKKKDHLEIEISMGIRKTSYVLFKGYCIPFR